MIPNRITLHHSLTSDSETVSWPVIRKYQTKTCGWTDIGYHFGIENLRGSVETLIGRLPNIQGAHVKGYNENNLGICFVGNYDVTEVPSDMWDTGVRLCKYLWHTYKITDIKGHREYNSQKSCPGKNFNLEKFRRAVFL